MREILGSLRRADNNFNMINDGDKVAVGLSGGKDSLTLVKALKEYQYIKQFELIAITIDCTNGKTDFSGIQKFCDDIGVELIIEPSNIFDVIFKIRKEKSPCSLCSKMRRGLLNATAKARGCNKIALGHHGDDMVETFLLCLTHESRVNTFQAVSYLDRIDVTVIRPLIYVREAQIIANAKAGKYPILNNCCEVNGLTRREYMKDIVKKLDKDIAGARDSMIDAVGKWLRGFNV